MGIALGSGLCYEYKITVCVGESIFFLTKESDVSENTKHVNDMEMLTFSHMFYFSKTYNWNLKTSNAGADPNFLVEGVGDSELT